MTRFADPDRCPDCSAALPAGATACPECRLLLRHPLSHELYATLVSADDLLGRLRTASVSALTAPAPDPTPTGPAYVAPPRARRRGLRPTSVPALLLGLGALCLLVASVLFLAVAWSWLGVAGRTAVLVGLTVAAAGLGARLATHGLRFAGEALSTVSLGLLILDVMGAEHSGWLGRPDLPQVLLILGLTLLAASLAWTLTLPRLVAPQLVAGLGFLVAYAGLVEATGYALVAQALSVVAAAGLAALAGTREVAPLGWVALVVGGWTWLVLALNGLSDALEPPTFRALWAADGTAWSLLAAAGLLLLPLLFGPTATQRTLCLAGSSSVLAAVVALPAVDEGPTRVALAALAVVVLGALVAAALPRRWAAVPLAPAALAALPLGATAAALGLQGLAGLSLVGDPFTATATTRVDPLTAYAAPGLLVPAVAALLLLALVLALVAAGPRTVRVPLAAPLVLLALAAVATLGLLATPLWVAVGALAALGLALLARGFVTTDAALAAATGVLGLAAVLALPSAGLTAGVAALGAAGAAGLLLRDGSARSRTGAGVLLPVALSGALWALLEVVAVDPAGRGLPVLVTAGLLALALPRYEVEVSAGLVALVAGTTAVGDAGTATSLALHLTVAGALVTSSSLLHEHRRVLAVPGGLLLAAATWVRLADLGVTAPEAYTLPTATVLLLLGLDRLRRHPESPTSVLLPGLLLGVVPSLLWVLGDPVSPRAVVLGGALLALTLAGTRLRWNAPLVVGAAGGAVLVLRELAPYTGQTPQWVLIGLAGTLLTVVGVTWEQRMGQVRQAVGYLDRLR